MSEQRLNYVKLAPEGIAAMRAVEHYVNTGTGLEAVLLEMVRLRASQMNGCQYCIGTHSHELRKHNEPEARIAEVARWRESAAFTERERAGLAWTERLTRLDGEEVSDAEFAAVREHFDETELVNLSIAIAGINAWNRLGVSFLPQWREPDAAVRTEVKV